MKSALRRFLDYFKYREGFLKIPGFLEAFKVETQKLAVMRAQVLLYLGIIIYLAVSILDFAVYPNEASGFLIIRVAFAILATITLFLLRSEWGKRNVFGLLLLCALFAELGVSVMTSQVGGWTSIYFVGNVLTTSGVTLFVPWRPRSNLIYTLSSLVGYVLINSALHPVGTEALTPLCFILINVILCYFATVGNETSRMGQLAARLDIEKAHHELKMQATLITKQIDAAKEIQRSLLPPLNQNLGGVIVEAIYEPSADLSGDFFDTAQCGDWVYIYIADVTGHGIAAAQVTYLVKEIFKQAVVRDLNLEELFDVVRRDYVAHKLDYDLGLQLMRLNSKTGATEFLRSNAPAPILVKDNAEVNRLEAPISPLISSANQDLTRPAQVIRLSPEKGETIYLYSDGAYEFQQRSGGEFGLRRLSQSMAATNKGSWPTALVEKLKAENAESSFPDDITILRIRRS